MKARIGPWLGIVFVLSGAAFLVAALGAMSSLGIASAPLQWVYGLTGLVAGRMLLSGPLKSPAMGRPIPATPKTD